MAENLISPGISISETDQSAYAARPMAAGAALVGPTVKGPVNIPTKVSSYADFVRRFGETFMAEAAGDKAAVQQEFMTSMAAKSYFEQGGDTLLVTRVANGTWKHAEAEIVDAETSEAAKVLKFITLGEGAIFNSATKGTKDNLKIRISNVNDFRGTFSVEVLRGDSDVDAKDVTILETWNNVSLDPESNNYIERVIGSQYPEVKSSEDTQIVMNGEYATSSQFICARVLKPTPSYVEDTDKTFLPKDGIYTFSGAQGELPTSEAKFFGDINPASDTSIQGVAADDYELAFAVLANKDEYEINMVSAPGYFGTELEALAEGRGDCIAIVDLAVDKDSAAASVANEAAAHNSSYAATYWPWLQMYSATGKLVWVPASVVIPGIYKYNDNAAAPWFAPAGMTRGGVQGAVQAYKKLSKAERDALYEKNVNPIATLPPAGLVVYGQKTLQKKASALDRVNVRRLLIEVKKKVKDFAAELLFEQNTDAVRASFKSKVNPYLETIAKRQGLYGYRLVVDELNTADVIDRNEFRAQIYLQPTKTIEFIYLDFTITATGVEFND